MELLLSKVLCTFDETVRWFRSGEAARSDVRLRLGACRHWRPNVQLPDDAELDASTHAVLCALVLWVEMCMAMAQRAVPWSSRDAVYGREDTEELAPHEATQRNERFLWRLRLASALDLAYHMENHGVYDDATLQRRELDYEQTDYERLRPLDHWYFWCGELPDLVHSLKWVDWFGGFSELERDELASAHPDEGFLAGTVSWNSVTNTSSNPLSRIPLLVIFSKVKPGLCHFKRWHDEIVRQCEDSTAGIYELQTLLIRCTLFGLYPHCETGPSFPRQLQLMKLFCEDAVRDRPATIRWFADHDMLLWFSWKEYIVHLMRYHPGLRAVLVRQRNWRAFELTTAYGTDVARRAFDEHGLLESSSLSVKKELHLVYTKRQVSEVRRSQKETFISCLVASLNRVFDQKHIAYRCFMPEHELRKTCQRVYHADETSRLREQRERDEEQHFVRMLTELHASVGDAQPAALFHDEQEEEEEEEEMRQYDDQMAYQARRDARNAFFKQKRADIIEQHVHRIVRDAPKVVHGLWEAERDRDCARHLRQLCLYRAVLLEHDPTFAPDPEQVMRDAALARRLDVDASGEGSFLTMWRKRDKPASPAMMALYRKLIRRQRRDLERSLRATPPLLTDHARAVTPWFLRPAAPPSLANQRLWTALEAARPAWSAMVRALVRLKRTMLSRMEAEEGSENNLVLFVRDSPPAAEEHVYDEDEEERQRQLAAKERDRITGMRDFSQNGALSEQEMRLMREFVSHFSPSDRIVPADFELWGVDPQLVRQLFELWERYERCEAFYQGTRETLYFTFWFARPRDFHLVHALAVHLKEHFQLRWQLVPRDAADRQLDALRARHELHEWEETPDELLYTHFCPSCRSLACRVMKGSSGEAVAHEIGVANAAYDWDEDRLYAKSAQTRSQHAAKTRRTARQQSDNPRKDAEREAKRARRVRFFPRCNDQPLEQLFAVGVRWTIGRTVNTLCERCGIKTVLTEQSCADANGSVCPCCRYSERDAIQFKDDEWQEARRVMDPHERTRVESRMVTASSTGRTRMVTETVRVRNDDDHPDLQLDAHDQCFFCQASERAVRKRRPYVQWHRYRVLDDRRTNDFVTLTVCDVCFRRHYTHLKFKNVQWRLSQFIGFVATARPLVRKNRRLVPIFEPRR